MVGETQKESKDSQGYLTQLALKEEQRMGSSRATENVKAQRQERVRWCV